MLDLDQIYSLTEIVQKKTPMIHCFSTSITANDCANIILSVGGKPIMAEELLEVGHITSISDALSVSLGQMQESRIKSIMCSGKVAKEQNIPTVIDLVGVGCSPFRLKVAKDFVQNCQPAVIKGNVSEIKSFLQASTDVKGVDVCKKDAVMDVASIVTFAQQTAREFNAIIVITGEQDVIVDEKNSYILENGHSMLAKITGTGCMLNVLIATFISTGKIIEGCLLATAMLAIAGELAAKTAKGIGSFKVDLMDNIYYFTKETFLTKVSLGKDVVQ